MACASIRTDQLDTERLFGLVERADIGSKDDSESMIGPSLSASKSGGPFADSATDFEINYATFGKISVLRLPQRLPTTTSLRRPDALQGVLGRGVISNT
jgi:hypothetical protein